MSTLPEPDQGVGSEAASKAADVRRSVEVQLIEGSMTVGELFEQVDAEQATGQNYIVGHMHLRAALLALPHIGEKRADEILEEIGVEGSRHLASLGSDQQRALAQAVTDRQPTQN